MTVSKTIGCILLAGALAACSNAASATLGETSVVTLGSGNGLDPNEMLTPGAPQFVITTNWQSNDTNVTTSSAGLNFLAAADPNLCIDISGGGASPNTTVQTWSCNGYDAAQAWFLYNGQLHTQAGLCLDTAGDDFTQDLQVITQPCDTTATRRNQLWNFTAGLLQITNSSRCLTLNTDTEGTRPQLADCNFPDARQHWIGARSDGNNIRGAVISTSLANSACLYVADSTNDGTALTLKACDFGVMEQFVMEGTHLRALGKCVQAASTLGAPLTIEDCSNDVSQQWVWSEGALQLAADLKKCVGLVNSSTTDGAPVQVQACSGAQAQQWSLGSHY